MTKGSIVFQYNPNLDLRNALELVDYELTRTVMVCFAMPPFKLAMECL